MKLYSFKGKAKVALCVMNMLQAYHNSSMRYVFLFLEEIVCLQECCFFLVMLCSPSLMLLDIQNPGHPPVYNKIHGTRARASRIELYSPGKLRFSSILFANP